MPFSTVLYQYFGEASANALKTKVEEILPQALSNLIKGVLNSKRSVDLRIFPLRIQFWHLNVSPSKVNWEQRGLFW